MEAGDFLNQKHSAFAGFPLCRSKLLSSILRTTIVRWEIWVKTIVLLFSLCTVMWYSPLFEDVTTNIYTIERNFKQKAMAPHSSTLAWKIPWTEEPGRLQSMVAKSRTRLSDFTFAFHFYALEKEMATHSSVLAWRIPGTGETGGLLSLGSHRVGHDWSDLAAAAAEDLNDRPLSTHSSGG